MSLVAASTISRRGVSATAVVVRATCSPHHENDYDDHDQDKPDNRWDGHIEPPLDHDAFNLVYQVPT